MQEDMRGGGNLAKSNSLELDVIIKEPFTKEKTPSLSQSYDSQEESCKKRGTKVEKLDVQLAIRHQARDSNDGIRTVSEATNSVSISKSSLSDDQKPKINLKPAKN